MIQVTIPGNQKITLIMQKRFSKNIKECIDYRDKSPAAFLNLSYSSLAYCLFNRNILMSSSPNESPESITDSTNISTITHSDEHSGTSEPITSLATEPEPVVKSESDMEISNSKPSQDSTDDGELIYPKTEPVSPEPKQVNTPHPRMIPPILHSINGNDIRIPIPTRTANAANAIMLIGPRSDSDREEQSGTFFLPPTGKQCLTNTHSCHLLELLIPGTTNYSDIYVDIRTSQQIADRITYINITAHLGISLDDQTRLTRIWRMIADLILSEIISNTARAVFNYHCVDLIELWINLTMLGWTADEQGASPAGNIDQMALHILRRLLTEDIT